MKRNSLLFAALAVMPVPAFSAVTYVDAVFTGASANTTLADGTAMNLVADQASLANPEDYANLGDSTAPNVTHWIERPRAAANGGTVFVAPPNFGGTNVDVPVIKTTISGLSAGASYNTYGFFWGRTGGDNWNIQFGSSEAGLTEFDDEGTLASTLTFAGATPSFSDGGGSILLEAASLGVLTANASGEIEVFVNDGSSLDRSWYDGVGFELVPEPSSSLLLGLGALALLRRRRA